MLSVKEKGLLLNIVKHCNKILSKIERLTKEKFDKDEDSVEIICFNIIQIGELVKNFDSSFIKKYNGQPWKQIKGMRDKVAHGYGTIDLDKVWNTALKDIKPLLDYCKNLLIKN